MSQTIDPMSALSPMRLRRAVSSTSVEFGSANSLFNDESWSDYDDAPGFLHSTSSTDLRRAAGSGVTFSSTYGGVSKRPLVNSAQIEPETPMRKVRGQSVSGFAQSGLVTPQSASQSFSSTSLSAQCGPSQSLPSPLDTPLVTPMSGSLDNTLDYFYDAKRPQDWHNTFDFPMGPPMRSPPHLSARSEMARSLSATCSFIKTDEDFPSASFSELSESRPVVAKHTNSGVNPFYCPPPCLRARSVSEMPRDRSMPFLENLTDLDSSLDSDGAGASLNVFGGNANFNPSFEETTKGAFVSGGGASQLLDTSFDSSDVQEAKFHAGSDFNAASHLHLPSEVSRNSRDQSVMSMPDLSRSRSSSTTSCNSLDSEKPFLCMLCTKRFRRMEHLRRHQKTHTLERPFKCTVVNCGRRFSRTDNLKAHILTHTKKSGRNEYIEGLAEMQDIKPIKRRNPRRGES